MASLKVHITFPEEKIKEPVIYQIGKEYNVITNIRKADVTEKTGWVDLEGYALVGTDSGLVIAHRNGLMVLDPGAIVLGVIVRLRRGEPARAAGDWLSSMALFVYAAGFSWAYLTLPAATRGRSYPYGSSLACSCHQGSGDGVQSGSG